MRVGINALSAKTGGGFTYMANFITALESLETDNKNEYIFFVSSELCKHYKVKRNNFKFVSCAFAGNSLFIKIFWEQVILPILVRVHRINCLFIPQNICTLFLFRKQVIVVRNMEVFCFQDYTNSVLRNLKNHILFFLTKISLRISNEIIFISEEAKNYITQKYHISPEKTAVIYHGRSTDFKPCNIAGDRRDIQSLFYEFDFSGKYLLTIASIVSYRNYMELLKAFNLIRTKYKMDLKLVIVGNVLDKRYFRKLNKFISDTMLTKEILSLGYIKDREKLHTLYCNCEAFVFTSTIEGCSNVLIEAMACGCCMLVSDMSSIPEICGDAAIYFNPYNYEEIADKIMVIMQDENYRQKLSKKALKRANDFSWTKTVFETLKVINLCGT